MPTPVPSSKEALKKPTVSESAKSVVERAPKKTEKPKLSKEVSKGLVGTQEGVAEVLAGVEKPSEQVSKAVGERGAQGQLKKGGVSDQGAKVQGIRAGLQDYTFPSEEVMVKHIREAIEDQIRLEWRRALSFEKRIGRGGAEAYNTSIAKIRKLKDLISSLFTSTIDFLKNVYIKYFLPNGKRRKIGEG